MCYLQRETEALTVSVGNAVRGVRAGSEPAGETGEGMAKGFARGTVEVDGGVYRLNR